MDPAKMRLELVKALVVGYGESVSDGVWKAKKLESWVLEVPGLETMRLDLIKLTYRFGRPPTETLREAKLLEDYIVPSAQEPISRKRRQS